MKTRFLPHLVRPFKSVPHGLPAAREKESPVVPGLHDERVFIAVCLLASFLAPTMRAVAQAPTAPPANVDEGRKLFASYGCYQCHGYEGQGSSATGPRLGPRPLPLASFSRYVRRPTGQMPPYTAKVLPDTELADIYAFLQSVPMPAGTPALLK